MKSIFKKILGLFILSFLVLIIFKNTDLKTITAKNGNINLTKFDLQTVTTLDGQWQIIWNKLVDPEQIDKEIDKSYITLPTDLSISHEGEFLKDARGVATLKLNLNGLKKDTIYGIAAPYFSSANKIWIDKKLMSETGKVDSKEENYKAKYIPSEVFFETKEESAEIVIQIANFHHRRIRLLPIKFGLYKVINKAINIKLIKQSLIIGSLLLIGIYYIILYEIQRKEKAMIYLGIISITIAIREMIVHERILMRLIPDFPAEWMMKLGYLPVFIILPVIAVYIQCIFNVKELEKLISFLKNFGVIMSIVIIVTNIRIYDWLFEYVSFLILIVASYLIYIIISKRLIEKTKRAETMAIGLIAVFFGAFNDVFRELGIINTPEMLSIGIVIFILFQAVFLSWRFNDSFEQIAQLSEENESMYEELEELNTELEEKIKQRTSDLERANKELSRLTIKDPLTNIGNRRYCDERLKQCWNENQKEHISVGLIMIDIDFFKNYNDLYGHIKGDWCLKLVAKTLKSSVKNQNYSISRYGGEEFLIIMPKADYEESINIATNIQNKIAEQKIDHKNSLISDKLTISMGVGIFLDEIFENERAWVDKTDELLYVAKNSGRNQFKADQF